jgi:WD40 repeat protein
MTVPTLTRCVEVDHNGTPSPACTGTANTSIFAIAFSPDGRFMVTSGVDDERVRIWRFDGRTPTLDTPVLRTLGAGHIAFSPDGRILAVASETGRVVDIYDVGTWALRETFNTGFTGDIWGLGIAPDSQQVITADYESGGSGKLFRHRLGGGALVQATTPLDPNSIAVSPVLAANGNVVIGIADNAGFVGVMELGATGFSPGTMLTFSGSINDRTYAVAFSPDGRLLAASNYSGRVAFWAIPLAGTLTPTGASLMATNMASVYGLAFTPDGQWIGLAASNEASIWNVGTRARRGRFVPPRGGLSIAFSPTGGVMAVGGRECGKVLICAD